MSQVQRIFLSLLLALGLLGTAAYALVPGGAPALPAKVYAGSYFVKNTFRFPAGKDRACLVVDSMARFEEVFGAAAVMGGKQEWITPETFTDRVVLAVIRDGMWDMRLDSAAALPDGVQVRYSADRNDVSYKAVTPLIFTLPKGSGTTTYRFIENGEPADVVAAR